jgi:endonuclease/exonuclease/phosphatase (EEP) superfamily protein YafD
VSALAPLEQSRPRGLLRRAIVLGLNVLLLWICLCAVANFAPLEWGFFEFVLIYPPPLGLAALCVPLAVFFARRKQTLRLTGCILSALGLFLSLGWEGSAPANGAAEFALLSVNCHDETAGAAALAQRCEAERVDFVLLQELDDENWPPFVEALAAYQFFWGDRSKFAFDVGQVTCLTGVKKAMLGEPPDVLVETGITGFRTFATRIGIQSRRLWLVNVHGPRPFYPSKHFRGLLGANADHSAHRQERDRLTEWLIRHQELPVVAAGDFNAPRKASNVRLPGMTLAYEAAGSGLHLTFPTYCPLVGIDHILGNQHVAFHSYATFYAGFSDHKAQLVRFSLRKPVAD